jgi:DICT domain-containing protein
VTGAKGSDAMDELAGKIEELEVKAAESALIADLSTDWEVRTYNSRLAKDLQAAAESLRRHAQAIRNNIV